MKGCTPSAVLSAKYEAVAVLMVRCVSVSDIALKAATVLPTWFSFMSKTETKIEQYH